MYGKVTATYFRASDHAEVIAPSKVVSTDMSPESPDRACSRSAIHSNSPAKDWKTAPNHSTAQCQTEILAQVSSFLFGFTSPQKTSPVCPTGLSSFSSACQLSIILCLQCLLRLRSNMLLTCESFRPLISVCPWKRACRWMSWAAWHRAMGNKDPAGEE